MKRRSRLDLSAGVAPDKPQAAGFEQVSAPPSGEPEAAAEWAAAAPSATRPAPRKRKSSSPARSLIVKTVAVVAVAALALYVLKRRFY